MNLRYDPPPAFAHAFVFNGNPGSTPAEPEGALALPGAYRVRLTVDGRRYTQPLTVTRDPRSRAAPAALAAQHVFLLRLTSGLKATWADFKPVAELRDRVRQIAPSDTTSELGKAAKLLTATLDSIAGDSLEDVRLVWDSRPAAWNFVNLNREFALQLGVQDNADQTPTRASLAVARASCGDLGKLVGRWRQFVQQDLVRFNQLLVRKGTAPLLAPSARASLCGA